MEEGMSISHQREILEVFRLRARRGIPLCLLQQARCRRSYSITTPSQRNPSATKIYKYMS